MMFVAGTCVALTIQVILMALGVSAIIQTSELLFNSLKVLGVCYLLYLAWQAFTQPLEMTATRTLSKTHWGALFRKGIALNFSTPMTPLFLLIFIPSFIDADAGNITAQSLQIGLLIPATFLLMYTTYSVAADKIGKKLLQSERNRRYLQRGAALTIAGFAVYLAIAQQSL